MSTFNTLVFFVYNIRHVEWQRCLGPFDCTVETQIVRLMTPLLCALMFKIAKALEMFERHETNVILPMLFYCFSSKLMNTLLRLKVRLFLFSDSEYPVRLL